jgi:Flp pilus assembly protein TadD
VALAPNDPMTRFNYGLSLVEKGDLRGAIDQYRAGLRSAPDHVRLLDALATALAAVGQREAAEATFRRALTLAPDDARTVEDYRATLGTSRR